MSTPPDLHMSFPNRFAPLSAKDQPLPVLYLCGRLETERLQI